MGYRTYFTLEVTPEPSQELLDLCFDGYDTVEDLINNNIDEMKWYSHDEDMLKISKNFPEYLFTLDGEGEESGDIWRSFYKNNSMYTWSIDVKPPEFEESRLVPQEYVSPNEIYGPGGYEDKGAK